MLMTFYFSLVAVMVSKSYWIFVVTTALNGTSSSIQARALLVHSVGRAHQLEMCNFSLNSYSGQPRLNILDVSLNAICVKLTHSLSFAN